MRHKILFYFNNNNSPNIPSCKSIVLLIICRIKSRAEVEFKDMAYFGTNETALQEIHDLNVTTVKINIGEGLKMHHIEEANKLYSTMHQ